MQALKRRTDARIVNQKLFHMAKILPGKELDGMPKLLDGQEAIISAINPIYYADEITNELKRVQIDLEETIEEEVTTFRETRNTVQFRKNANGVSIYRAGKNTLRMKMLQRKKANVTSGEDETLTFVPKELKLATKQKTRQDFITDEAYTEHTVRPGYVKEEITLPKLPSDVGEQKAYRIIYRYESKTLVPVKVDKKILWNTSNGETILRMPRPITTDADGKRIPCMYRVDRQNKRIAIEVDAQKLKAAKFPVVIDPDVSTGQSDLTADTCVYDENYDADGYTGYRYNFFRFALPSLSGGTFVSADFKPYCTDADSSITFTIKADDVGSWTEASTAATLKALSFNGDISTGNQATTTGRKTYSITGDATKGAQKAYTDSATHITVRLEDTYSTSWDDDNFVTSSLRMGNDLDGVQSEFADRTVISPSDRWAYLTVTYTSSAGPPTSDFTVDDTTPEAGVQVSFTDLSDDGGATITDWLWTFGDGNSSTLENPNHTYLTGGTKTVSLKVTNSEGNDTETKTDYITVSLPAASTKILTGNVGLAKMYVSTDSGTSYTQLPKLYAAAYPGTTTDLYEATHTDITDNVKRWLAGWEDGQEIEIAHRFTEALTQQLDALPTTTLDFKLVWSDPTHTIADPYVTWRGSITGKSDDWPIDNVFGTSYNIKVIEKPELFQGV